MALKRLTTAEMVQISEPWTAQDGPSRKTLQSIPELAGVLPRLDAAHKEVLAARKPEDDPRTAAITREATEIDTRHDATIRGVDLVLQGIALLVGNNTPRAQAMDAARRVLTPDGLSIVSSTYRNEAGAAEQLKTRLRSETDVKALLASIAVFEKKTLTSFVNERIQLAAKLGELEDERARLLATRPEITAAANLNARNAWIRAVHALLANAELAQISEATHTALFGALHQAEKKADRRAKAAPAAPTLGPADPDESQIANPPESIASEASQTTA